MHALPSRLLFAGLLLAPCLAAQVVVRDTIVPLPPLSICQDGATHRTTCTGLRLRPGVLRDLVPFERQPLEITGNPGMITCAFVDVTAIRVLPTNQFVLAGTAGGTMTAQFHGDAPAGHVFLVFLATGIAGPITVPPFQGPVHLDPARAVFVGLFVPLGTATPYHTVSFPANPLLQGIGFFDQAVALDPAGAASTTIVDCFEF